MPVEIRVPHLGESVVEATVGKWLKNEGDQVDAGEPLVELETEKVSLEVAAEAAGVLAKIEKPEGETVHVGEALGSLDEAAERATPSAAPAPPPPAAEAPTPAAPPPAAVPEEEEEPARGPATSPSVRRLVEEHGLDLGQIEGSGPGGRVMREDVLSFLEKQRAADTTAPAPPTETSEQPAPSPAPPRPEAPPRAEAPAAPAVVPTAPGREERVRLSRRRLTIARRLVEAQQTAAMLTTFNEVDMSAVMELRRRRQPAFLERHGIKLGFMSFFAKAAVAALKAFPNFNAELQGEELVLKHYYDIGIAVDTEGGLVVPVVRNADARNFAEIEREISELATRARENKLALADLQGGTFTITNGGIFGSLLSTPILNTPQVGILGMHRIQERPMAVNGEVVVRPMMYLALTYDHRVVDGREAVQFLVRIKELIEDPEAMLLEG